jgi:adenylate cyclase
VVRFVPMLFQAPGTILPSFVLAAAAAALDTSPVLAADTIRLAGRTVRTDVGFHLPIRYYGPAGAIRHVSAAAVLGNSMDPDAVRGQLALIGVTALGAGDVFATPFSRTVPGVEVMATAITNLLADDALVRTRTVRWIDGATAVLLPVAVLALLAMTRPLTGTSLAVALVLAWLAAVTGAFAAGYWLSIAVPLAALVPVAAGYALVRLAVDRSLAQRFATEAAALARFHPPPMAGAIARDAGFLRQPVLRDVAVVFLDLSGFTGVSEALGPEWTRDLLATFHEQVEACVSAHQGTVISFMGDGAMIVFGLPEPRPDDPARALAAVTALSAAIGAWMQGLPPIARDRLTVRIGGHYGAAVLSRLGSRQHQHVTATGDTVNVTSRLLEVGKTERAAIVISQALADAAERAGLPHGALDGLTPKAVAIRGREQPLRVLLGP